MLFICDLPFILFIFYLPSFQRKKEIKKRRDASEALTLSRPAANHKNNTSNYVKSA